MTTLREAAQQALEALKGYRRELGDQQPCDAEQALEAALAEPVQEPVAYSIGRTLHWHEGKGVSDAQLFAVPPQRKPLTEEEIKECERQAMVNGSLPFEQRVFFARAVERAHGIV